VDEINRVLIYTASETHGASVGHIHLLGSLARWRGIEGLLQSMVEIPVGALDDPLGLFAAGVGDSDRRGAALAIATGLALRGMSGHE
jgi:Tfp pilus assembly PilM family ATPase